MSLRSMSALILVGGLLAGRAAAAEVQPPVEEARRLYQALIERQAHGAIKLLKFSQFDGVALDSPPGAYQMDVNTVVEFQQPCAKLRVPGQPSVFADFQVKTPQEVRLLGPDKAVSFEKGHQVMVVGTLRFDRRGKGWGLMSWEVLFARPYKEADPAALARGERYLRLLERQAADVTAAAGDCGRLGAALSRHLEEDVATLGALRTGPQPTPDDQHGINERYGERMTRAAGKTDRIAACTSDPKVRTYSQRTSQ